MSGGSWSCGVCCCVAAAAVVVVASLLKSAFIKAIKLERCWLDSSESAPKVAVLSPDDIAAEATSRGRSASSTTADNLRIGLATAD